MLLALLDLLLYAFFYVYLGLHALLAYPPLEHIIILEVSES